MLSEASQASAVDNVLNSLDENKDLVLNRADITDFWISLGLQVLV